MADPGAHDETRAIRPCAAHGSTRQPDRRRARGDCRALSSRRWARQRPTPTCPSRTLAS